MVAAALCKVDVEDMEVGWHLAEACLDKDLAVTEVVARMRV